MSLFRPIPKPKPKGILKFRQNRISAKTAEIRPKTETESVSVVLYLWSITNFEKKISGPAPPQAHWAQVQSGQGRVQILVKMWK